MFDELPDRLQDYISECFVSGDEISFSKNETSNLIIVKPKIKEWLVLCEWEDGNDRYNIINICGPTIDLVLRALNNVKGS